MKSENKVVRKLEELADKLQKMGESITDEGERENPPTEQAAELCFLIGNLFAIGWVLDQEEELKELATKFKVAASLQSLKGML